MLGLTIALLTAAALAFILFQGRRKARVSQAAEAARKAVEAQLNSETNQDDRR
jgi:hypothetical protein